MNPQVRPVYLPRIQLLSPRNCLFEELFGLSPVKVLPLTVKNPRCSRSPKADCSIRATSRERTDVINVKLPTVCIDNTDGAYRDSIRASLRKTQSVKSPRCPHSPKPHHRTCFSYRSACFQSPFRQNAMLCPSSRLRATTGD